MQSAEGVIVKGVGGLYYAREAEGETHVLRARGPGEGEEHGWVEEILPRESRLVRPPVANVRYLLIVLAPAPAPDFLLIDTLIAMALRQGIRTSATWTRAPARSCGAITRGWARPFWR